MDYIKHYAARIAELSHHLPNQSVCLLKSADAKTRSNDTEYYYRQNSDFYYLTGLEETDLCLAIKKNEGKTEIVLFCKDSDITEIQWLGPRLGVEGIKTTKLYTDVFAIEKLPTKILALLEGARHIYFDFAENVQWHQTIMGWLNTLQAKNRKGVVSPDTLKNMTKIIHEMRLFKKTEEITLLQKAADISCQAHIRAMQKTKPGMMEYALEAEYLHEFYAAGARSPAYNSIVGGGENACILHYVNNNKVLTDKSLVLVDAACEYQYYCADITRTFPVNGQFSAPQQAIYELVLAAQEAAIDIIKPGILFSAIQDKVLDILVPGLVALKILKGDMQLLIESKQYQPFYMHNSGHWLGLDVHDCGEYKIDNQSRKLEAGMVLTVEPGLYFSSLLLKNTDIDPKWLGIGIRIEDDILVTAQGHRNLTQAAPKRVSDIHHVMS